MLLQVIFSTNKKVPLFNGTVLAVYNYANKDKVNGENVNKNKQILCARVPNNKLKSKLLVAPCFLPNFLGGDYWVIAVGPTSDNYKWAIISGGNQQVQYKDGCTTKTDGVNGAGFGFLQEIKIQMKILLTK